MRTTSLLFALSILPCFASSAHAEEWQGGYVGVSASVDDTHDKTNTISIVALPIGPVPTGTYNDTAPSLGGLVGYRIEAGPIVLGGEADADWSGASIKEADAILTNALKPRWRASLRAVAGVPLGKTLIFGTAGWGVSATRYLYTFNLGDPIAPQNASRTTGGLVAGGGIELALGKLHPRIEYRHARYKKVVNGASTHIFRHRLSSDSLRASLILPL